MTSVRPDLYDATVPSDGRTVDTVNGPVDMVAVMRYLAGDAGIRLTDAESIAMRRLDPYNHRSRPADDPAVRTAAYVRLARDLIGPLAA